MKRTILLLAIIFIFFNSAYGQRQSWVVKPADTDPQITTDLEGHYVAINRSVARKNQLFLFLPGTGGLPIFYQLISNRAADLGFHVINLNYPNAQAVNDLCASGTDLDCYADVRLETIDGTDRTSLIDVNRANSIENRLIKLLIFLGKQYPNDNWGQFLTDNQQINWPAIVVSGHSQGAGHAGIIARYHPVARSVMFAGLDYNGRLQQLANWIAKPASTPNASSPDKFWAFQHQLDELVNFQINSTQTWLAYGMLTFGPVVNIDNNIAPYQNSHALFSDLTVNSTVATIYHGCIVVDARVPKNSDGTPIYQPVWDYLLSNTVTTPASVAIENVTFTKKQLIIAGSGFAASANIVTVNGTDISSLLTSESNSQLIAVGKKAKLKLKKGQNIITVSANGVTSNSFAFNLP